MPFFEIDVPTPLSDCISHCEVECVMGCCGIDAVSTDPALIEEWVHEAGLEQALRALTQVEDLMAVVENPLNHVVSHFLNHQTGNENGRSTLLTFLQRFKEALQTATQGARNDIEEEGRDPD